MTSYKVEGFTLIEFVITLIIIGILAVIAIPSYTNYIRTSYYSEVVLAASPFKVAVAECYEKLGTVIGCTAGSNHIAANITTKTGAVSKLIVTDGVITVTPVPAHGITTEDTYILTPTVSNNVLIWEVSGKGVAKGYTS